MIHTEQDRPALTDVVITPAMIEAGVHVLQEYDPKTDRVSEVARQIVEASLAISPNARIQK